MKISNLLSNLSLKNFAGVLTLSIASALLMGCEPNQSSTADSAQETHTFKTDASIDGHTKTFVGCYTIDKSEPAQIKIAQLDNRLIMQMKEPSSANRVWDDPEPLEVIDVDKTPNYFSIDSDKVTHLLARPDRLFVIAHIDNAYVNLHPLLDSDYLGFILQGANTIFKVECDEIPTDENAEDDSHQISLKPINTNI